jgi:hypothetical protein
MSATKMRHISLDALEIKTFRQVYNLTLEGSKISRIDR